MGAPPELFVPGLIFFVIGLALLTASFWPSRKPVVVAVQPVEERPLDGVAAADAPLIAPAPTPPSHWTRAIDPNAGDLDDAERVRVLDGLGVLGDAWSTDLLLRALDDERGDVRVAVIENLARCDDTRVAAALQRAYASPVVAERYAAVDGASRRGDVPLLAHALGDGDVNVATAAAYGLTRAERGDLLADGLAEREDGNAEAIRATLATLA